MSDRCTARYEPEASDQRTHTCTLKPGHDGRHLCPVCATPWADEEPVLFISPAVAARVTLLLGRPLKASDRFVVTRQGNKNENPAALAAGGGHAADAG